MFFTTYVLPKHFLYLYYLFKNRFNFKNYVFFVFWVWLVDRPVDRQLNIVSWTLAWSTKYAQ